MPQALAHLKVLDLTHHVAGPFCTRLLADYGAEVLKIERPGRGDPGRRLGPFLHDRPDLEKSGTFLHLNHNKLGITLNLKSATGVRIFHDLVRWADVVVENFRPGVMDRLGIPYCSLLQIKPGIIMTSISNFGQSGPYRDYKAEEIVEYAIGGPMLYTGTAEREPVKLGGRVGLYYAGQVAAVATLTAAFRQGLDGSGDHIDISIMETQAGSIDRQTSMLVNYQYTGRRWSRLPTQQSYLGTVYPCKDGWIDFRGRERMRMVATMLDLKEFLQDPHIDSRGSNEDLNLVQTLDKAARDWLGCHARQEVWSKAQAHRVLSAPLNTMADVLADPHFRGRGLWTLEEREGTGILDYPARPALMRDSPWQLRRPAPRLGQHNEETYCGFLGFSRADLSRLGAMGVI